jgi:hypothetical protein
MSLGRRDIVKQQDRSHLDASRITVARAHVQHSSERENELASWRGVGGTIDAYMQ